MVSPKRLPPVLGLPRLRLNNCISTSSISLTRHLGCFCNDPLGHESLSYYQLLAGLASLSCRCRKLSEIFYLFQVVKLGDPLNNYTSTNSFCCTGINGALTTPSLVLHSILLALTSVSIPYIYSTCSVCTLVILVSLHNTFELFEKNIQHIL